MKANEFVRKFGFKSAKYWIDHFNNVNTLPDEFINIEFLNNLKRLIESHEFVERNDGIESAKMMIERTKFPLSDRIIRLKRAIADVESCMEVV